jgi:wyosine [tRNA(Phe)-imidazoG37] synthetase (radical SAM superfamily)
VDPLHLASAYRRHPRRWQSNLYVYPVISRRSRGISVGINLNPDKACNFDCVYCQVDRTVPPIVRRVDLDVLAAELDALLEAVRAGTLFEEEPFHSLPPERRSVRDIAFSGDGEPTTYPRFDEAVEIAAKARHRHGLLDTKIVLITDAAYLTRPVVRRGLEILDANHGEVWAKLDAGSEAFFRAVNRPNVSLETVLAGIFDAALVRPIVIQTLWMRLHGKLPPDAEVDAYCGRLNAILSQGGRLAWTQLYTIARRPAEAFVTALSDTELDGIADRVRARVPVTVDVFYGVPPEAADNR